MPTNRMHKFDEVILRELSRIMLEYFPDIIVSVTQVHTSKDMSFAKVWLSSVDDVDLVVEKSQKKAGEFRSILANNVTARKVPRLYFVADKTEDKAAELENLIKHANDTN